MKLKKAGKILSKRFFKRSEVLERFNPVNYIAIHCADTKSSMDVSVEDITRWHKKRGFSSIGYHLFIKFDGSIHRGRDLDGDGYVLDEVGAHVADYNSVSIGICLEGGYDGENNFTDEQWESLKSILLELQLYFPEAEIRGHRDFPRVKKSCPSFDVKTKCKEFGINPNW